MCVRLGITFGGSRDSSERKASVSGEKRNATLQILKANPESTIDAIVTIAKVSRETVKRSLKSLSEKDLIKRVGSDKTGH